MDKRVLGKSGIGVARSAWAAWESRTRAETRCPTTRPRTSRSSGPRDGLYLLQHRRSATLARALMGPRRTTRTWWARRSRRCATRLSLPPSSASRTGQDHPRGLAPPRLSVSRWRRACAGCAPTTSTSTTSTESTQRSSPEVVADTMADLIKEGKIRAWGIFRGDGGCLRRADAVCPSPPSRTATP